MKRELTRVSFGLFAMIGATNLAYAERNGRDRREARGERGVQCPMMIIRK